VLVKVISRRGTISVVFVVLLVLLLGVVDASIEERVEREERETMSSSSSSSKPWVSGKKKRQSWCDPKKICDYCQDAIYEGNKKKQACRFRPRDLKLKRPGSSGRVIAPVASSRSKEGTL